MSDKSVKNSPALIVDGWAIGLLMLALLLGSATLQAAVPAPASAKRGAPSPSAPVEVTYQLPEQVPAGQPLTIALTVTTPIEDGALWVEVAKQENLVVMSAATVRIDLAGAARPLVVPLQILPGAETERSLVLLVSVDTPAGSMSRSFRISLPAPAAAEPAANGGAHSEGMKILPSD